MKEKITILCLSRILTATTSPVTVSSALRTFAAKHKREKKKKGKKRGKKEQRTILSLSDGFQHLKLAHLLAGRRSPAIVLKRQRLSSAGSRSARRRHCTKDDRRKTLRKPLYSSSRSKVIFCCFFFTVCCGAVRCSLACCDTMLRVEVRRRSSFFF